MNNIKEMLSATIEIEGLLRVMRHGSSPEAEALLADKIDYLVELYTEGIRGDESAKDHIVEKTIPDKSIEDKSIEDKSIEGKSLENEPVSEAPTGERALSDKPVWLNESMARQNSSDLRKAFSLNDRYRFINNLFAGDKAEFERFIDRLSTLDNSDAAYNMMVDKLGDDESNPELEDFFTIVLNHF